MSRMQGVPAGDAYDDGSVGNPIVEFASHNGTTQTEYRDRDA
jgi:hypothetical protein